MNIVRGLGKRKIAVVDESVKNSVRGLGGSEIPVVQKTAADWWLSGGIDPADVAGVWQPKGAASLDASYLRLAGDEGYSNIDPAVVGGVAPGWSADDGWCFDGTNYLRSGVIPDVGASMFIRYDNFPQDEPRKFAGVFPSPSYFCFISIFTTWRYYSGPEINEIISVMPIAGVIGGAGMSAYFDGVFVGGKSTSGWTKGTNDIYIGDVNGAYGTKFFGNIQSIVVYKTTLTAAQALAVSDAMAAL